MCINSAAVAAITIQMTTYFGIWKFNTTIPPPQDPKIGLQQNLLFLSLLKRQLESGDLKEVHTFLEGNSGYFLSGDITEEQLHKNLLQWSPYITFEVHRTVPGLKSVEALVAVSRERVALMTVPA